MESSQHTGHSRKNKSGNRSRATSKNQPSGDNPVSPRGDSHRSHGESSRRKKSAHGSHASRSRKDAQSSDRNESSEGRSSRRSKSKTKNMSQSGITGWKSEFEGEKGAKPSAIKQKLKNDIKELELKKKKFKKKLEEIALQSETQEQDIIVLNQKVKEEVIELNKMNLEIDQQNQRIKMLNMVKERNDHFQKTLKGQQQFNNELANDHKQKTTALQNKGEKENKDDGNGGGVVKYEADQQATQLLSNVVNFRLGQTLDEVRSNAMILSGIAQPSTQVQAVCVKFIFIEKILQVAGQPEIAQLKQMKEPDTVQKALEQMAQQKGVKDQDKEKDANLLDDIDFDLIDSCSYVATFKVYQTTTFDEIKNAACEFWNFEKHSDQWILTDEYFNNLATYKDSVQNFYSEASGYQPLNAQCEACVFLLRKNPQRVGLHFLQYESVELQDDNNKKEGADNLQEGSDDEGGGAQDAKSKKKPKKINIQKIAETIVGLKTYEVRIDDQKMRTYVKWTESHTNPSVSIWAFITAIILLYLNIYGKQIKNDYMEEYAVRKIIESFYNMEITHLNEEDEQENHNHSDMTTAGDTQDLAGKLRALQEISQEEVITEAVYEKEKIATSTLVISNKQNLHDYFVDDFATLFFTKGKYVQQRLRIVGPVRLRTIHTKEETCRFKTDLNKCYYSSMIDANLYKEEIDGVKFQTCEENSISHSISGENAVFGCQGYVVDAFPNENSPKDFANLIDNHLEVLFGDRARGMNIEMTMYLPRADWWIYVQILYEYGIQGEQVLSRPSSNFQTFRLNIYQTPGDTKALRDQGIEVDTYGETLLYFDAIKLSLYTIYYGKQQFNDIRFFLSNYHKASFSDVFQLVWNAMVSFFNIANFVLFTMLSFGQDVNFILRENKYVNSYGLMRLYWRAQLFDSILVLMNMFMLIQFTTISRRVSLLFKLIAITAPYLLYLILSYVLMLYLMAMIVWQVWGDKLAYFRYIQISMMYTLALFDLKSMYLGQDFMSANQFGVDSMWLFILIVLFAIVLHYSVTLQYSAYFHIYFNIAKKYETRLHDDYDGLRKRGIVKEWLMGLKKNPLKDDPVEEDE